MQAKEKIKKNHHESVNESKNNMQGKQKIKKNRHESNSSMQYKQKIKKNHHEILNESNNSMQAKAKIKKNRHEIMNETVSEDLDDSINSQSSGDDVEDEGTNNTQAKQKVEKGLQDVMYESDSGESDEESESESDDSSGEENEELDHKWQELRNEALDTNETTRRIAVCNMDWDRIRAIDLFVCFNSFKPASGCISSVKIYPSEFGLKRMEEERLKGPPELTEETLPVDEEEVEDKNGSKFHREKLRQYQLSRLKYYYAVVECDSPETANTVYEQLNGMEYESSAVRFDLRFVPDDMTFDHEPKSVADKMPDSMEYKPRLFVTTALQQVKVDLTWDETDPKRREFFQKIFKEPDSVQNEIQDYIASASSESEEEADAAADDDDSGKKSSTQERIAKYRELLLSLEEKEKEEEEKYDVEVTWEPGLEKKTEEKVKEKIKKDSLNPFEELLLKKKEDKKLKKKEQKLMQKQTGESGDSEEDSSETASRNEKKLAELALISDSKKETVPEESTKKKKKSESHELEGFVGDMQDPRFSAMFTSSLFNMVPSDQHPKKEIRQTKNKKFKRKNSESGHSKKARYH